MNKKKIGLIAIMLCFICVALIVYINKTATRVIRVGGFDMEYTPKDRKLTVEDFEAVELGISEQELIDQIGEPDGYVGYELGPGRIVYVLEDGRTVSIIFQESKLYRITLYNGNRMDDIIKTELGPNQVFVAYGMILDCPPEERFTLEDFDAVELGDTYSDMVEKIGRGNYDIRFQSSISWIDPIYVLEDGKSVEAYFMNGYYLYKLAVFEGDNQVCVLKSVDENDIREVHYNGNDIQYVTQHRNLTVEDFEDIELGVTISDIEEKIGRPDIRVWGWGNEPAYVLEDGRVAVCCLSGDEERIYLEKIVIYNGDDIDQVLKEMDEQPQGME